MRLTNCNVAPRQPSNANYIHAVSNMCILCVSAVPFKGKSDAGPPKKKKKCKKRHFKDEATDGKSPTTQQKPSPSAAAQKSKAAAKPSKSNTEATNGAAPQKPQGTSGLF